MTWKAWHELEFPLLVPVQPEFLINSPCNCRTITEFATTLTMKASPAWTQLNSEGNSIHLAVSPALGPLLSSPSTTGHRAHVCLLYKSMQIPKGSFLSKNLGSYSFMNNKCKDYSLVLLSLNGQVWKSLPDTCVLKFHFVPSDLVQSFHFLLFEIC